MALISAWIERAIDSLQRNLACSQPGFKTSLEDCVASDRMVFEDLPNVPLWHGNQKPALR